ncbi:hypothetical protein JOC77_003349 [Peribacillus deserti]|uniref:Uncharacterized protein n=1 Tax=Peribacillus deserti TaxID=673318 RepID=A0ABS2QL58_9BACI|nr:hypothetical protein [Peribacillus deserti]
MHFATSLVGIHLIAGMCVKEKHTLKSLSIKFL